MLKTFLMSRSPLVDIPHSNGHGRRQLGFVPVARQGNLIVSSTNTMTNEQLRAKLIELVKAQGKPFGLLIDDIAGGFTFHWPWSASGLPGSSARRLQSVPRWPPRSTRSRRGHRRHAARLTHQNRRHRQQAGNLQWLLRCGIRLGAGFGGRPCDSDLRDGSTKERDVHGPASDFAAACARS